MVRENPDPYLVLGVSPTATQADITHAYRARLRAHHPDTRHTPCSQKADEHLRQVLAAYALLRDPARRAEPRNEQKRQEADADPAGRTPRDRGHIETEDQERDDRGGTEGGGDPVYAGPFADLLRRPRAPEI